MMKWLQHGGRVLRLAAVVAVAVLAASAPAEAGFLAAFSGNTQPSHGSTGVQGTVNFAVYDRTGGVAGDTFNTGLAGFDTKFLAGSGSAAFDTTAKFLYVYQTVNNSGNTSLVPISTNTVGATPALLTSFGSFTGTTFSTTVLGAAAGFADPSPASTGATPTVTTASGLFVPTVLLGATSLKALYSPEIPVGSKGQLWGYTSNAAPIFVTTGLIDGGTTANGTAPAAATVPEPSAVVLSLIGLPLALALRRRAARI